MKKLIWFIVGLPCSQLLAAQTINLECVLTGSLFQYRNGKLDKEMSCDHTKEKCVATYHVSIQPIGDDIYKLAYSSLKNSRDKGEIDPIASQSKFSNSTDMAHWKGNVFYASSYWSMHMKEWNGNPAYHLTTKDYWEINRMTGAVTRNKSSDITPPQPDSYTYDDKSTGTCKAFTPKF